MIDFESIYNSLSLDEKIGQMLCFDLGKMSSEEITELYYKTKVGSFFVANVPKESIKMATDIVNDMSTVPCMIAADIECGPGHVLGGETKVTNPMSWGATDNEKLIYDAHVAIAERCRELGIHWTFSPISDININPNNPVTNVRAVGDIPERVARICAAAIDGMQANGLIMAGCKHFPGDGVDDRNQHFCTSVNSLSKEEWINSFGYVYRELFKHNVASIMVGHIALPAFDEKVNDYIGYPPGILSYNLMTKLLKGELGFDGCIVSDALCMIGACSVVPQERLAIEFVKAGGDILLFPTVDYFYQLKEACINKEITEERLHDAVIRVLKLKARARLFEDQSKVISDIKHSKSLDELTQEIADQSITLIRNYGDVFPLNLNKGDKILILDIKESEGKEGRFYSCDLDEVEKELQQRGFVTERFVNGNRSDFTEKLSEYAVVLINCKISSQDYGGGSLRVGWSHIAPFWRGAVLQHPKVVFTSFGDPYKIHDFPYVKNYINAYSCCESTQRAFVKAILGEIPFKGKSPVSFSGYFNAEI